MQRGATLACLSFHATDAGAWYRLEYDYGIENKKPLKRYFVVEKGI